MKALIDTVESMASAKFVRFTSFYNFDIIPGLSFYLDFLPWPYREGLWIEEIWI